MCGRNRGTLRTVKRSPTAEDLEPPLRDRFPKHDAVAVRSLYHELAVAV